MAGEPAGVRMSRVPAAETRWRQIAWRLYEHLPRAADLPLRIGTSAMLPWVNRHVPLTLIRGRAHSGDAATMLFAGAPAAAAYLVRRFFVDEPIATAIDPVPSWRLHGELARRRATVDLVVARLDRATAALALDASYVAVPEWVGAHAAIPPDVTRFCRASKSLAHNLARTRRAGFRTTVGHALHDFEEFYDRMYVPFVRRRHHGESVVADRVRLRRCFRQGGVVWTLRGDERIAGLLFRVRGRILDLVVLGTADGAQQPLRDGAIFALEASLFEYAGTLGCSVVDFGGSRPSPSDGLLLSKARWGGRLVASRSTAYDLCLGWTQLTPSLLAFFTRTPLIVRQSDGLAALFGPGSGVVIRAARPIRRSLQRVYVLDDAATAADAIAGESPIIYVDPRRHPDWLPPPTAGPAGRA